MARIALCLSGHLREFETAWPYLKTNVIDVIEPDVFGFTWTDSFGYYMHKVSKEHQSFTLGYDPASGEVPNHYIDSVCQRLFPKILKTRDSKNVSSFLDHLVKSNEDIEPKDWGWHRPRAKYQMLLGRQESIQLKAAYELKHKFVYDRVIYTRWDIVHENPISDDVLTGNAVKIPTRYNYSGLSDIWASGTSADMDIFCSMLARLPALRHKENFTTHQHHWLRDHCEHFGIEYQETDIPVSIANRPF